MIYKFLILSDEVDDFAREISIGSEATFFDFHNCILDSVKYKKDQITSFFLCSDDWEKEQEITLMEMDSSSEYDNLVMSETLLHDYISDEGQKLMYVFDYMSERAFFIELKEIVTAKELDAPVCTMHKGLPPEQIINEADFSAGFTPSTGIDESFYGDEGFELDELDEEGFSDMDENGPSNEDTNF